MAFATLSLLNLLAGDARGLSVHRSARLLGSRWCSKCNGIAGRERHVDSFVVLLLLDVLAHGSLPFGCGDNRAASARVPRLKFGTAHSLPRFPGTSETTERCPVREVEPAAIISIANKGTSASKANYMGGARRVRALALGKIKLSRTIKEGANIKKGATAWPPNLDRASTWRRP